jgi:uncharacterized protein YcbX
VSPTAGGRVARLARYPVKACGGEALEVCDVGAAGLRNDRVLAVVVGDRIVTQREFATLARVRPVLDDATGRLTLSCDGTETREGTVDTDGPRREVALFDERVFVVEQPSELSEWFTRLLGQPAQLVGAPASTRRATPGLVAGQTVLSDEGSVSLHSQASLDRLNTALGDRGHGPVPADRFRANIVIDGLAAHAEDETGRFEVGEVVLGFGRRDERCVVTTVDQVAGARSGPEPLRTLADYRRDPSGGVCFGVYAAVVVPGRIRVGDPVILTPRS